MALPLASLVLGNSGSLCFKITAADQHLGFCCFTCQKVESSKDQRKHQNDAKKAEKPNVEDIITILSHVLEIGMFVPTHTHGHTPENLSYIQQ